MRKVQFLIVPACLLAIALQTFVVGAPAKKPPRAKPPTKWSKEVQRVFPKNPKSLLVGERPDFGTQVATTATNVSPGSPTSPEPASGGATAWSRLINRDVLADEVKSYQPLLAKQLATLSAFKGGGYEESRLYYSMLAVCMAITAEHDGDVRWKDQAAGARDMFARVGANLKVATDASYKEAKLRQEDLEALVRGDRIEAKPAEPTASWEKVADFTLLMKRLDQAHKERLTPWTSNKADFEQNADSVIHEAQIVAALAEIIPKDGYDYAGDDAFATLAEEMKKGAVNAATAATSNNYEGARTAVSAIYQACEKCHGDYR